MFEILNIYQRFLMDIYARFFSVFVVILYAKIFQEGFSPAYYDKVYAL